MKLFMRDDRGAVALLTAIIISILLTIIVSGLVSLMISELRQSEDAEQSVRAYYAAQSGVEDGIQKVVAALGSAKVDQLCGSAGSQNVNLDPSSPGTVGWTCQQITYSGSPTGTLPQPDKAVQVDLGAATFGSMTLSWDITPMPPGGFAANFFRAPLGGFPSAGAGWNHPAAIELAIIGYPAGSFSASTPGAINLTNILAIPETTGTGQVNYNAVLGNNPVTGLCNAAAASYHCTLTITNFPAGRNFTMRIRSRYTGSAYLMQFFSGPNGNGGIVKAPDGTATIDITSKAGDAYRRVIYKVPYQNDAAIGLDYVIYSDNDVCKDFSILAGAIENGGCPY